MMSGWVKPFTQSPACRMDTREMAITKATDAAVPGGETYVPLKHLKLSLPKNKLF